MSVAKLRPDAGVAPKVRHSIAQGATLGYGETQHTVVLKGRHSLVRVLRRLRFQLQKHALGESRPVGAADSNAAAHPGFRWAVESDPFGVGNYGEGALKNTERSRTETRRQAPHWRRLP